MIRTLQTNLTGGMLSRDSQDRLDLAIWKNGVQYAENIDIRPQGGAIRRPGMNAINTGLDITNPWMLDGFTFSADQQYGLAFTTGQVDIYRKWDRAFHQSITSAPWGVQHIQDRSLDLMQVFDTMIISAAEFETRVLTRYPSGFFDLQPIAFSWYWDGTQAAQRPPMHRYEAGYITVSGDNAAHDGLRHNLVASSPIWATDGSQDGTWFVVNGVYMQSLAVVDSQHATAFYSKAWDGAASTDWQEQAFSVRRGYPRCAVYHEQRLWLGGGASIPMTLFGSTTYDPFNFYLGTGQGTDAIKYTVASDRVAEMRRMISRNGMQIYATEAEFYMPTPDTGAVTPANVAVRRQSSYGIANATARAFDQSTVFISRIAGSVREFVYDLGQVSYTSDALTFMASDLLRTPIELTTVMEAQFAQQSLAILTNLDGTLAVLTKVRKEQVGAWKLWTAAVPRETWPDGYAQVIACGAVGREIWAMVERGDGHGSRNRSLEVFDPNFRLDYSRGLSADSPQTAWVAPVTYGNFVVHMVSGDLYMGTTLIDVAGNFTTPLAVTQVEIGFNPNLLIIPLVQEVQLADGTSFGMPRKICSTTISVQNSLNIAVDNDVMPETNVEEDPGIAPDRFTGKFKSWRLGWGTDEAPRISQSTPLPFTLRSIMMELEI